MKNIVPILVCCILIALGTGCAAQAAKAPQTLPGGWNLVWADEFDQPDGSALDPEKWTYNTGATGWGNNELQYYSNTTENAFIENGMLVIKAIKNPDETRKRYTSARVLTHSRGDWVYGRFEVRAKLPYGQGIWPAIWMLPTDWSYGSWPASGEIDIMEHIGKEPRRVYGTLHYGKPHTYEGGYFDLPEGETFADEFHVFAVEWDPQEIRWYMDGENYLTITEWFTSSTKSDYPAPFDQRFHIILNIAVGGVWPGNPDETTVFPQYMYVDYVRVYQKSNSE